MKIWMAAIKPHVSPRRFSPKSFRRGAFLYRTVFSKFSCFYPKTWIVSARLSSKSVRAEMRSRAEKAARARRAGEAERRGSTAFEGRAGWNIVCFLYLDLSRRG
jgi:hypothetical protein